MNIPENSSPLVELKTLDELWFQVGGTLCNLSCHHCFISCHPGNDSFGFLDLPTIEGYLEESRELGVKEYYFTGGEPFLNKDMLPILRRTLEYGPATVLTNGTAFTERSMRELGELNAKSRYSLEIRVSIDGFDSATNDPIRGEGTFDRAMSGVKLLVDAGFLPIITMTQTWSEEDSPRVLGSFVDRLKTEGYTRPRLKILPTLRLGEEENRSRPYSELECVTNEMMDGYDQDKLLCSRGRIVTDRGVAVCPILIESPDAHLSDTLAGSLSPFPMRHGACYTCYQYGSICSNVGSFGES